jgi:hypothetical protein
MGNRSRQTKGLEGSGVSILFPVPIEIKVKEIPQAEKTLT